MDLTDHRANRRTAQPPMLKAVVNHQPVEPDVTVIGIRTVHDKPNDVALEFHCLGQEAGQEPTLGNRVQVRGNQPALIVSDVEFGHFLPVLSTQIFKLHCRPHGPVLPRTAVPTPPIFGAANSLPASRGDEVLRLVGLSEVANKKAGGFSLGMSQRLGLAGALLGDPKVLLFDEPVNGLDPEGIVWIRKFMQSLAAEGRTVLVSSHLLSEMSLTAEHLVAPGRGQIGYSAAGRARRRHCREDDHRQPGRRPCPCRAGHAQ
ncbi:hypothetical protein J2X34_000904 [Rhodococcus sp. BE178]